MKNKIAYILLSIILIVSVGIRFYKLGQFPVGFTWDEASVGYNAYTIFHWGKDEYGKTFPLTFKSFGDDKNPVHVYLTVPFVGIWGLNETSTRASAAVFGVLNVAVIFFLARKMFKSNSIGVVASFFMCISPFAIQFSRFNHELNFAIFFFLTGLWLFYKGLENNIYLPLAFLLFGIDLLTYQSAKVVTPPLIVLLVILNIKKLLKYKKQVIFSALIYGFFVSLLFIKPELLGGARLQQNQIDPKIIENTEVFKRTGNKLYGTAEVVFERYIKYFEPQFLFISGDEIPRHSIQTVGEFYWMDMPLIVIGLLSLLYKLFFKKDLQMLIILAWVFLAPLPGAVSSVFSHAPRAMFMLGSITLVSSLGAYTLINIFSNKFYKATMSIILVIISGYYFSLYIKEYFGEYATKYAIEWVYGMKEAVQFSEKNNYSLVNMTDSFMQPYIFYLFYSKTPLPEFLATVKYNKTQSAPSNLVYSFGKYNFIWNQYHSMPTPGVLYIIRPSIYDGLYEKSAFDVAKVIKFPNDTDDLYLIEAKK